MATAKAKGPMVFKELTPEEQIAEIRKEAAQKIKELEKQLPWEKRFTALLNQYVSSRKQTIANCVRGYKPDESEFEDEVNAKLKEQEFKLVYKAASFDNDLYDRTQNSIDDYDLSEYPVYAVYEVQNLQKETLGFIQINCNYSSYNGNEYNNWTFVKPQQITCTIYNTYKP
jgi:hypothetical protein